MGLLGAFALSAGGTRVEAEVDASPKCSAESLLPLLPVKENDNNQCNEGGSEVPALLLFLSIEPRREIRAVPTLVPSFEEIDSVTASGVTAKNGN